MRLIIALLLVAGCGARPVRPTPAPVASAPPASSPSSPLSVPSASPAPHPRVTEVDEPIVVGACNERKVQVSITRATGEGSFILRLSCSGETFAVSSDRARPDGVQLQNVFKIEPAEWERAYRAIERLHWRTFDDACPPAERRIGQSLGPVYRVEVQDGSDRRSFHCAGTQVYTDELDRLHARLLALAPSPGTVAATAEDRIGVTQCDRFLDLYRRCIETKVPTAERAELLSALSDTRVRLRDALVADPTAGPGLSKTCADLQREAITATKKYGCKF